MSTPGNVFVIGAREGFAPRIGLLVSQLENARHYLLRASRELTSAELDAAPGRAPNTIGAMLAHVDAAENLFQRLSFEDRKFDEQETARYNPYFEFEGGERSRGREIGAYVRDLEETRRRTLEGMQRQDEARHTGQIILI